MENRVFNRSRLVDLDRAKGFAIFLVVLGHIVATDVPKGNEWYADIKFFIYKFHMPFFMYLSGIIMAYTFPVIIDFKDYFKYVYKRFSRLAPGYLLFGLLIYFGKVYMSKIFQVDGLPGDICDELYKLMVVPSRSAGGSLWFVYVLMEMYLVFPWLIVLLGRYFFVVLILGVVLRSVEATDVLMLDRFCEYFLFFGVGVLVVQFYDKYLEFIDRSKYLLFFLFLVSLLIVPYVSAGFSKTVIGLSSLAAIHAVMRKGVLSKLGVWEIYGKYTYSIYLLNTILIGVIKGILLRFMSWDGVNFFVFAPVLLVSGMYGSIFVKRHLFSKVSYLDRITS